MKLYEVLYDCEECISEELIIGRGAPLDELVGYMDELQQELEHETDEEIRDQIEQEIEELDYIIKSKTGQIGEAAIRQYKRIGQEIKKRYRCLSGPKAGKLVATPGACATRKDPRKVRQGRRVMRSKKGVIQRKGRVAKRKQMSKMVARMNKRLSGKA